MKTLVIGSRGSMGRRYMAILRYLKEEVYGVDKEFKSYGLLPCFDRYIVATPTTNHYPMLRMLCAQGKPILCEKPISFQGYEIEHLKKLSEQAGSDIRMVSNWTWAINRSLQRVGEVAIRGEMEIEYNYYHSGNDGFFWDCIQPIYLAGRFKYNRNSPIFDCKVNGNPVTLDDFSHSYPAMISEWLYGDKKRLFSLEDAMKANEKVESAMRLEPDPVVGDIHFTGSMA